MELLVRVVGLRVRLLGVSSDSFWGVQPYVF
jgi:hypothetical protein